MPILEFKATINAKAIRDLIKLMATKQHTYVDVLIAESVPAEE